MRCISEALDQSMSICKGRQQARLRLQRLFHLAQRGKGHDEGSRDGIIHVKVQTAGDQHFSDQADF